MDEQVEVEKKESSLFGCVTIFAFAALAWSVWYAGSAEQELAEVQASNAYAAYQPALTPESAAASASSPAASPVPEVAEPEPEVIEPVQTTDLDNAEKAVSLIINLSGNLCAKPLEVQDVGGGLYGVHCVTNRDGTGRSTYLVNSRTSKVEEI